MWGEIPNSKHQKETRIQQIKQIVTNKIRVNLFNPSNPRPIAFILEFGI